MPQKAAVVRREWGAASVKKKGDWISMNLRTGARDLECLDIMNGLLRKGTPL